MLRLLIYYNQQWRRSWGCSRIP